MRRCGKLTWRQMSPVLEIGNRRAVNADKRWLLSKSERLSVGLSLFILVSAPSQTLGQSRDSGQTGQIQGRHTPAQRVSGTMQGLPALPGVMQAGVDIPLVRTTQPGRADTLKSSGLPPSLPDPGNSGEVSRLGSADTVGRLGLAGIPLNDLPRGARDSTNLNFKDTDLRDIFRAISFQHGLNIFLDNSINKATTIALNRVQVFDALAFLCEQNGLTLSFAGGIFSVKPPPPPPPPPPPRPHVPLISFDGGLLSVQLKNDDLERVIQEVHDKTGHNILVTGGTAGTLSGTLKGIEFELGFTQILNNNGFAVQNNKGIYIVSRLDYFVGKTQESSRTGPYWVSVRDSLVTIDVTSAPIDRVIPDIIRQLNTDVVFYDALAGNVTIRATGIGIEKALSLILRNSPYTYRESDGLYFVGEKTNKALGVTRLMKLRYLRADKISDLIPQSISSQAIIKPIREQNGFVVISTNDVIQQMEEFLNAVDRPVAQVLIEALVVDYDLSHASEFGIEAGLTGSPDTSGFRRSGSLLPQIDFNATGPWLNDRLKKAGKFDFLGHEINLASLGSLPADFYLRVKALEERGLANIRSRPLIATLNGQQASLSIGTTQYYLLKSTVPYRDQNQVLFQETQTFQTIDADVKLEITPYVGSDSLITVELKPDFRTPVGGFNSVVPPTINRRALNSTLIIKNGETIVLGGLIEESEVENRTQVPILGSIPLIGKFFGSTTKSNRKSELLIYITPHVSFGEQFQSASLPGPHD